MLQLNKLLVFLLIASFVHSSLSYDLIFNTDKDITQWTFNGSYIYSKSISSVAALLPTSLANSSKENDRRHIGVWLARHSESDTENFFSLKYSLKHHLFKQGLVHFIASPNVPLTVTTLNNEEVGKFWSNGKTWCDALFSVNLYNTISIDIYTPDSRDYVLIDKVILGVMADISLDTRQLNPCLTSPSNNTMIYDDLAPDMIQKLPPLLNKTQTRHGDHTPPDMINKSSHNRHLHRSTGGAPDMVDKAQTPRLDTRTFTTNNESDTESQNSDPSEVKCGCSCSCSRMKGKKTNNATMSTTG